MGKTDLVRFGPDQLRVTPWRGDHTIAQITPTARHAPSSDLVDRCVQALERGGYRGALTSALTEAEQQPFLAAGFVVHERLHLLRHELRREPDDRRAPPGVRLRRARRGDRPAVLEVDGSAFSPFWRFDERGLDDARRATPSSRFRVADDADVVGYAVTGRAGALGYLQRLAVRPERQGQGIGAALISDALHWARRHGCNSVLVNTQESNVAALLVYQHLGFSREPHGLAVLERPFSGLEASA
jgi:[ribosomal protein S18]-alanine N-acetyltransferase